MNTMRAVVLNAYGPADKAFSFENTPMPEVKENQVLIRIKVAAFNPVDWKIRDGWYGGTPPKIIGCDCSGTVVAVGPNVKHLAVNDEVMAMTLLGGSNGSYAEYTSAPVELVAKKPAGLSFEQAAGVPLAAMTAYRAVIANRAFKKDDVVFVAGLGGGVGSFAIQFLRQIGVKTIFTVARDAASAQFLQQQMGIKPENIVIYGGVAPEETKSLLGGANHGRLFDATLDLVGGEMKKMCLELTGCSGHFATILPEAGFTFPFWDENSIPRGRNLSVHQTAIAAEIENGDRKSWEIYAHHLSLICSMLQNGTLRPPQTQVVGPLSTMSVQQAHALLESRRVKGKLVMVIE